MFPILFRIPNAWSMMATGVLVAEVFVGVAGALLWLWASLNKRSGWWVGIASTATFLVAGHLVLSWLIDHKGPITIYTFGVLVVIGFLVATWYAAIQAKPLGVEPSRVLDYGMWILLSGIVGARLLYVFLNQGEFIAEKGKVLKLWEGGLVWYGGMMMAIPVGLYALRRFKMPVLRMVDITATVTLLGLGIGRWACFCMADDYGRPTDLPWGVRFNDANALVAEKLRGVALHPTQLYMSVNALWLFFIVEWIRRRARYAGTALGWMLILYAITRALVIEPFRGDFVERNPSYGAHKEAEFAIGKGEETPALELKRETVVTDIETGATGQLLSDVSLPEGLARATVHAISDKPLAKDTAWNPTEVAGLPPEVSVRLVASVPYDSHLPSPPGYVSTSQWIGVLILVLGVGVLLLARKLDEPGYSAAVESSQASAVSSEN